MQGPRGFQGYQGFQGFQGAQGAQGPRGYQGYQGTTGPGFQYERIVWVDPNGNDSTGQLGKPEYPFRSIKAALAILASNSLTNGTVYVHPGNYPGTNEYAWAITTANTGVSIILEGPVEINHTNTLNALCNVSNDCGLSIVGAMHNINDSLLSSTMIGGAIIHSTSSREVFRFVSGGDRQVLGLKNLHVVHDQPGTNRGSINCGSVDGIVHVMMEHVYFFTGGTDNYNIYTSQPSMKLSLNQCTFYTDTTNIKLLADGPHNIGAFDCKFEVKQPLDSRGWIETRVTTTGSHMSWGNNTFYGTPGPEKFYMWWEYGGVSVTNDLDIFGACFGTHNVVYAAGGLGVPNNTTAGGGSIIFGGMSIQPPSNYVF